LSFDDHKSRTFLNAQQATDVARVEFERLANALKLDAGFYHLLRQVGIRAKTRKYVLDTKKKVSRRPIKYV
jgi:hypothetical protein